MGLGVSYERGTPVALPRRVHRRAQPIHKPSEWEQIAFFGSLDLYHSSPDSSKFQCQSEDSKKAIFSRSGGCWMDGRQQWALQDYPADKKHPPPKDLHRSLGIGLQ